MTEWRKVRLGDVVSIKSGLSYKSEYIGKGDNLLLGMGCVSYKEKFVESGARPYSQDCDPKYLAVPGDIVLATRQQSDNLPILAMPAIIPEKYAGRKIIIGTNLYKVENNSDIDNRFLFWVLKGKDYVNYIRGVKTGTTVQMVSKRNVEEYHFLCPPQSVRDRIVSILSRYDALIENYQRQIKLLEEAAQRLYKEWFVDLRFPGHQSTPIINNLPQSWQKKTVEECLIFHGNGGWGKDSHTGKYEHPGKVIRGTDIEDIKTGRYSDLPLRFHTDNDIKKRTLKKNDLVFELSNGNINNIGRCLLIDDIILNNTGDNTICASFCKLLRPIDRFHALMLYWEIQDMQTSGRMLPLKKQGANGINNFDFDGFLNHVLLIPADESLISPLEIITRRIGRIQGEIALLSEARDRLLPKLMSAEIEV